MPNDATTHMLQLAAFRLHVIIKICEHLRDLNITSDEAISQITGEATEAVVLVRKAYNDLQASISDIPPHDPVTSPTTQAALVAKCDTISDEELAALEEQEAYEEIARIEKEELARLRKTSTKASGS